MGHIEPVFGKAKFIFTDYQTYFSTASGPWSNIWEFNGQKDTLPYLKGLPVLFKDFDITGVKTAKLYFTALGCCEIFINGQRVGSDELKPGYSSYEKRALYYEYDVTGLIKEGANRILAVLSAGWYSGRISNGLCGNKEPAFLAALNIDGKNAVITDETWQAFTGGQIRFADIWDGEVRDARLADYSELSIPGAKTEDCKNADICDYFDGDVTPFIGPTVKIREGLDLKPVSMALSDGIKYNGSDFGELNIVNVSNSFPVSVKRGQMLTVDFAQESVGWVKLKVKAKPGTRIQMRYAEFLNDSGLLSRGNDGAKGSVYTVNLRTAKAKAVFYTGNGEVSEYRPTFTFFGYRYLELVSDGEFEVLDMTAQVVGSDNNEIGRIETSDELINKLISNVIWGQRSNYLFVPTDCPQRDERLGWTGDTQAFSTTAAYNADVYGFFRKWLQDVRDAQGESGEVTDVVPRSGIFGSFDAAAWADAAVIVPYNLYRIYGKKEMIEEHFDCMDKYVRHLINEYGYRGPEPRYGDWLAYEYCDNAFLSSAFLVHDIDMLMYLAGEIGKNDAVSYYRQEREKAYAYFQENFLADGYPVKDTQTDYVISLAFGLLDEENAKKAVARLKEKIVKNGFRLSTGFVGTYNLCPALSMMGEDNLAYSLLMQRGDPSWLYSVEQGATTIWERWNSYTKEKGFGDVGMNSFNHYAYGSIMEWMYRFMAGIEPEEPGFSRILLQPRVDTRSGDELPEGQSLMKWVKAEYQSTNGKITSAWSTEDGFVYECEIPTEATLHLPVFGDQLTINGIEHKPGDFERKGDCLVIELAPGKYVFEQ